MAAHSLWNPFRIHRFTKAGNISVENHDGGKGRMRNDEARNVEYFIEKGENGVGGSGRGMGEGVVGKLRGIRNSKGNRSNSRDKIIILVVYTQFSRPLT